MFHKDMTGVKKKFNAQGFSLIEIILASGLVGLFAVAFLGVLGFSQESTLRAAQRNRAVFLAEEGLEAARAIRDENFSNLSAGDHGLKSDTKWSLAGQTDIAGDFTRTLKIVDINSQTKQVDSQVVWKQSGGNQVSVIFSTLLTDWRTAVSAGTSTQFCGI